MALFLAFLVVGLSFGSACSSGPDGLPPIKFDAAVVWESEHFEYYVQEGDDSVCEGVMATLELHFQAIQKFLDFPWPEGRKVKYYKLLKGDDPRDFGCVGGSLACYRGQGELVSPEVFHKHELIHAYVGPIDWDSDTPRPQFLEEGIAEALGPSRIRQRTVPGEWRELFDDDPLANNALPQQAAGFVGHLLNHYPVEQFMDWFLSVEYGDSVERMARQFETAYGKTVDEAWEEALTTSPDMIQPLLAYECSGPTISPDEGEIQVDGAACDGERFRTLRVDGTTTVALHSSQTKRPSLLHCDRQEWLPWSNRHVLVLPPEGGYLLYHTEDEALSLSFEILPNGFVRECEAGAAVTLSEVLEGYQSTGFTLSVPTGQWYVNLQSPPGTHSLKVDFLQGVTLDVCDECGDECASLSVWDELSFDDDERLLLRIEGNPDEPDESRHARIDLVRE